VSIKTTSTDITLRMTASQKMGEAIDVKRRTFTHVTSAILQADNASHLSRVLRLWITSYTIIVRYT